MFLQKLKFESQRNVAQKESARFWRKNFLLSKLHLKERPTNLIRNVSQRNNLSQIINVHFFLIKVFSCDSIIFSRTITAFAKTVSFLALFFYLWFVVFALYNEMGRDGNNYQMQPNYGISYTNQTVPKSNMDHKNY